MPRAKRICPKPGCPRIAARRYCPEHEREYEAKRGTPAQRGYDSKHKAERQRWARIIAERGHIQCATCATIITHGQAWDLGHTEDRRSYLGPQCLTCNRSEGGRRGRATQS